MISLSLKSQTGLLFVFYITFTTICSLGSGVSKVNYNSAEQPPGSQCVLYTYPPGGIYLGRDVPYRQYSSSLTTIEHQRRGTALFV